MGTRMFLICSARKDWQARTVPSAKERVRGKFESCLTGNFSQEAEDYEDDDKDDDACKLQERHMCPACIASTAVMVAGAGSMGGILALCIGKFRKFFRANSLSLFQKTKEK